MAGRVGLAHAEIRATALLAVAVGASFEVLRLCLGTRRATGRSHGMRGRKCLGAALRLGDREQKRQDPS